MHRTIKIAMIIPLFLLSFSANALFMVEQYDNFWSQNLGALQNYSNANAASTTGYYEYIDFSDTNSNGLTPGFNLWPSDATDGIADSPIAPVNQTFFVKITGMFNVATAGLSRLRTWNDDGVFAFVDGALVINDPFLHPPRSRFSNVLNLTAGLHQLELYFFENGGGANLEVSFFDQSTGRYELARDTRPVPEPSIIALFAAGLIGLGFARRRKA